MSDYWMDHLSETLSEQNVVVYIWYVDEDRIEWAGDLKETFGFDRDDYPRSQRALNNIINPQHVPERSVLVHDILDNFEKQQALNKNPSLSLSYSMRCKDGSHVDVKEKASLHRYTMSGQRLLCGTLFIEQEEQIKMIDECSHFIPKEGNVAGYGNKTDLRVDNAL